MLAEVFNGMIDLPKSQYFFTKRATFWQIVFNFLSIIFLSIDTAIEDIISRITYSMREKVEKIGVFLAGGLVPKVACA